MPEIATLAGMESLSIMSNRSMPASVAISGMHRPEA